MLEGGSHHKGSVAVANDKTGQTTLQWRHFLFHGQRHGTKSGAICQGTRLEERTRTRRRRQPE